MAEGAKAGVVKMGRADGLTVRLSMLKETPAVFGTATAAIAAPEKLSGEEGGTRLKGWTGGASILTMGQAPAAGPGLQVVQQWEGRGFGLAGTATGGGRRGGEGRLVSWRWVEKDGRRGQW